MSKRFLLVLAAAVIAAVLLWPDDEQPSDKGKTPSISDTREPRQTRPAPWQFRPAPGEPMQQPPRSPAYTAPQGIHPSPAYPYGGAATEPFTTPYQQQPGPYSGYGFQPPQRTQGYGTAPQPPQYPGSGMPYGYPEPPTYRFRPLDEKETSRRYRGHYPRQDYSYPGAPPPGRR